MAMERLFPAHCVSCGARTPGHSHPFCEQCLIGTSLLTPEMIFLPRRRMAPVRVAALFEYGASVRRAITAGKYGGEPWRLRQLGRLCAPVARIFEPKVLVPVPSAASSLVRRGFHPAWEVAVGIADELGADVVMVGMRKRGYLTQASLSAAQRRQLAPSQFVISRLPRGPYLIVDDVITTGATVSAFATALELHGAKAAIGAVCVAASV